MDRCIWIPEILTLICNDLDRKSALSAALTSRAFLEPALDKLWHTIDSFRPLIACLPEDLWTTKIRPSPEEGKNNVILFLQRDFLPADLHRYLKYYAHRIQHFSPRVSPGMKMLSIEAFIALQTETSLQPGALSPRLKFCTWLSPHHVKSAFGYKSDFSRQLSPFMCLFVGESVVSLKFSDSRLDNPMDSVAIRATLKRLPHLKSLDFDRNFGSKFSSLLISSYSWDHLENLRAPDLSLASIAHIAKMPQLRRLEFTGVIEQIVGADFSTFNESGFLSLRELIMKCNMEDFTGFGHIQRWLPVAHHLQECSVHEFWPASPASVRKALDDIKLKCSAQTLKKIDLTEGTICMEHQAAQEEEDILDKEYREPLDLSPLHEFNQLEFLRVSVLGGVQLGPQALSQIPSIWPKLSTLDLLPSDEHNGRMPSIDHSHILQLLHSLPSLRVLRITFDTTQLSPDQPISSTPFNLRVLGVGYSPIISPSRVLKFLQAHLPQLESLQTPDLGDDDDPSIGLTMVQKRWKLVLETWEETEQ
ncbi:hypothetical protein DFP72DRAFT_902184 [Ephemerocybe angulata]|uniref:F-box domain-containing protein n=1 Tax=Ephemerocybe angulata TaxID=980116 RepID=A0A8H6HWM5_9AGAR|nr:hypothetical protein DFP72DRAFT_902184 [Tulosesus angulatus]